MGICETVAPVISTFSQVVYVRRRGKGSKKARTYCTYCIVWGLGTWSGSIHLFTCHRKVPTQSRYTKQECGEI